MQKRIEELEQEVIELGEKLSACQYQNSLLEKKIKNSQSEETAT